MTTSRSQNEILPVETENSGSTTKIQSQLQSKVKILDMTEARQAYIMERSKEAHALEVNAMIVNELFKELTELLDEQAPGLNEIGQRIEIAQVNTAVGANELKLVDKKTDVNRSWCVIM